MNEVKKHKIKMKIITTINLLIALFITYMLFADDINTRILKSHAMIYVTIDSYSYNDENYDYDFSYTVEGKEYSKKEYDTVLKYKEGDKAKACYKKKDPSDCGLYDMRISMILFSIIYVSTSVYLFIHSDELKKDDEFSTDGEFTNGSINSKEAMRRRMGEAKRKRNK